MKLYGSVTSPYVRRLRIWLEHADYEFIALDLYSSEGRSQLEAVSPARKVPVLQIGKDTLYDSRIIFYHLNERLHRETINIREDNLITLIDEANQAFAQLLMLKRSGVDITQDALYFNLQQERINNLMMHLESLADSGSFKTWNYPAICLYCLLDWIDFREQFNLDTTPALQTFRDTNRHREYVRKTDPRN